MEPEVEADRCYRRGRGSFTHEATFDLISWADGASGVDPQRDCETACRDDARKPYAAIRFREACLYTQC